VTATSATTIHGIVLTGPADQELLAFEGAGTHTRADLDTRARRTARRLRDLGVGPGDTVAVMLPNRIQFVDVILATSLLGGVVVPLHVAARGEMLDRALRLAAPAVLVGAATLAEQWRPVAEAWGLRAVVVDDTASGSADAVLDGGREPEGGPVRDAELPEVRGGDPVVVYASSGTTGPAKGVTLCHEALVEMTATAQTVMRYTADDVAYTPMPLFHANAFVFTFLSAVLAGARTIIAERFHASDFWERLATLGVTKTSLLGSAPSLLLLQPPSGHEGAHRVELIAAVPRPPDVADFEARFGVPVTEFYGSTEANLPIGIPFGSERRARSCGRLLPGWEHLIADETGRPVTPGDPGELCIRPTKPNLVSSGYWGEPERPSSCGATCGSTPAT
jgi:crotonobetaine/carnitine-CoA ligase